MNNEILDDLQDEIDYKKHVLLRGFYLSVLVLSYLATAVAWYEIESILISGPVGSAVGGILWWLSRKRNFSFGQAIGLSVPLFSILCFIVINFFSWGPSQAHTPIATAMSLYSMALTGTFFYANEAINAHK